MVGRWFKLPSQSVKGKEYIVVRSSQGVWSCQCPKQSFSKKDAKYCKHIEVVKPLVERDEIAQQWLTKNENHPKYEEGLEKYMKIADELKKYEFDYYESKKPKRFDAEYVKTRLMQMREERRAKIPKEDRDLQDAAFEVFGGDEDDR